MREQLRSVLQLKGKNRKFANFRFSLSHGRIVSAKCWRQNVHQKPNGSWTKRKGRFAALFSLCCCLEIDGLKSPFQMHRQRDHIEKRKQSHRDQKEKSLHFSDKRVKAAARISVKAINDGNKS